MELEMMHHLRGLFLSFLQSIGNKFKSLLLFTFIFVVEKSMSLLFKKILYAKVYSTPHRIHLKRMRAIRRNVI